MFQFYEWIGVRRILAKAFSFRLAECELRMRYESSSLIRSEERRFLQNKLYFSSPEESELFHW